MTLPTPEQIAEELVKATPVFFARRIGTESAREAFRAVAKELQQMSINSMKGTSAQRYKQLHTDLEKLYKQLEGKKVTK
jgi:hypothetical protein